MCADFFMCVFNNLACFAGGFELGAVDADLILRYNKTAGSWVFPLFLRCVFSGKRSMAVLFPFVQDSAVFFVLSNLFSFLSRRHDA